MCGIGGVEMTTSIGTLVPQVTVLVDMESVFLSRRAVESLQTHLYRYIASFLHNHIINHVVSRCTVPFS